MIFKETKLKGAFVIELEKREDERGFFARTFCRKEFEAHGLSPDMVQSNTSRSGRKGTLRGMHSQIAPHEEAKLLRCTRGGIYDVIVDLRPGSPTRRQWIGEELTRDNCRMLYVPKGFAHGFITLEDGTDVSYQMSDFYVPGSEKGFRYDDPAFGIRWPMKPVVLSDKDGAWPPYKE